MALNVTQTDGAGSAVNQACSATASTGATSRAASAGGSAGSTPVSTGNQNNGTHLSKVIIDWAVPDGATWGAGTWTVRLNISTGNTNLTIENVHICRMNSSNVSQATIGSLTAQAVSASAGVKTFNVSGSSQSPSAGDTVRLILSVSNQSGQMNQQLSWTPDQDVDTPFTAAAVEHVASGDLSAGTGALAGAAARTREHATTGELNAGTGTLAGSASRSGGSVTHDTSGTLSAGSGSLAGAANRTRAHDAAGSLAAGTGSLAGVAKVGGFSLYLTTGFVDNWGELSETPQTTATTSSGWTVSTGATNHSELESGVERAAATFTSTTPPDGSLDSTLGDALRAGPFNGSFSDANWTAAYGVIGVSTSGGGTQDGRIRFRLLKGANADGSGATEITSGQQQSSVASNISQAIEKNTSLQFNPGAFSVSNEYLFIQIAWERTGAGADANADVFLRTGRDNVTSPGTRIITASFTPSGGVTHATSGALGGPGASLSGAAARTRVHATTGVLSAGAGNLSGSAARTLVHATTGALQAAGSTLAGAAARTRQHAVTGVLSGPGALLDGAADRATPGAEHVASGALAGPGAQLSGAARIATHHTAGTLAGSGATLEGAAARTRTHTVTGALVGTGAVLVGAATLYKLHATAGTLSGSGAVLAGEALRIEAGSQEHFAIGALQGAGAALSGVALEEGHPIYGFGGRGRIGGTSGRPSSNGIGDTSGRPSSDGIGSTSA